MSSRTEAPWVKVYKVMPPFQTALAELRHQKGMTQTDLANELRVTQAYIAQLEAGERRIPAKFFFKLSRMLGVSEYELIFGSWHASLTFHLEQCREVSTDVVELLSDREGRRRFGALVRCLLKGNSIKTAEAILQSANDIARSRE